MRHKPFATQLTWLIGALALICAPAQAAGPNVLVNGDFEAGPPPGMGDHPYYAIPGWIPVNQTNWVKVDGPAGFDYLNHGPESDASAPGQGIAQHYLDIPPLVPEGVGSVYQSFTASCTGPVTFGGAFSTRDNVAGSGSISLVKGVGPGGGVVASAAASMPAGHSSTDPWVKLSQPAAVTAGATYSIVVSLNPNANFDNGFLSYDQGCLKPDGYDSCCPPWNPDLLQQLLVYKRSSGRFHPYTVYFQPVAQHNAQMQAYIDYLNKLNPAITDITIAFGLWDVATNIQVGNYHWYTWHAGGNGTPAFLGSLFPPGSMQVGRSYVVHTGIFLNDGLQFFPKKCWDNDVTVRVWPFDPDSPSAPHLKFRRSVGKRAFPSPERPIPRSQDAAPRG